MNNASFAGTFPPGQDIEPGQVSADRAYLRHEFLTYTGGQHWSSGWTPASARAAVDEHMTGWFARSATLARDCLRYPPIMGALRQRMAPALRTTWEVHGAARAPGRFAAEDLTAAWEQVRRLYGDILRDVAMMGMSWLHMHLYVDEHGLERPRIKRWPLEATSWRGASPAWPKGYYATTLDSGLVHMQHGDGKWAMIGNGERPHELGAIVALGLTYVAGELERRDRANLSEGAGRAAPVATLPEGLPIDSEVGKAVTNVVANIGRGRNGAVLPGGTTLEPFSISSDTSFFKEALQDELVMVAFALLGQSGTLTSGGGGVYTAPVFQGVAESLVDADIEGTIRGFTTGVAKPLTEINYPGVETPLLVASNPDRFSRAEGVGKRTQQFHEIVAKEKANGFDVTQDRVDSLASDLVIAPPRLAASPPPDSPPTEPPFSAPPTEPTP